MLILNVVGMSSLRHNWSQVCLILNHIADVAFLSQGVADRLSLAIIEMTIHHLVLHGRLHLERWDFSVRLERVSLHILVLKLELISVFVLLASEEVSASVLDDLGLLVHVAALALAVVDLCLVLLHEIAILLFHICRLYKLLVLQILLETLECAIGELVLAGLLSTCYLFVYFSLLKELVLVQGGGGTLVFAV